MGLHGFGIGELAGDEAALLLGDASGFVNSARHALGSRGKHQFRAKALEQVAPLNAHGFGHGEHATQAPNSRNQSNADAHIAAGGLHNKAARLQFAPLKGIFDKVKGHAILDGTAGVTIFKFEPDLAGQIL